MFPKLTSLTANPAKLRAPLAAIAGAAMIGLLFAMPFTTKAHAAENAPSAIQRIRSGAYTSMPEPSTALAHGAEGEGMTIKNGTGRDLYIYFNGPSTATVRVPNGTSVGVSLAVGSYEVAGEIPQSHILPFYGKQSYAPNIHYWLKFYLSH